MGVKVSIYQPRLNIFVPGIGTRELWCDLERVISLCNLYASLTIFGQALNTQ
jgi:hypothetical protein